MALNLENHTCVCDIFVSQVFRGQGFERRSLFAGLIQWLRLLAIVPRCESVENANLGTNKCLDLLNIETFQGSR